MASGCRSTGDEEVQCKEVIAELAGRGITISADATLSQLRQGYGEGVCLVLNELINQELVGRDFHFEAPLWAGQQAGADVQGGAYAEEVDEELDDSASVASQGSDGANDSDEFCNEFARSPAAVMERSLAGSNAALALEQVHQANVDPEAWRTECERVRPLLKMSTDVLGPLGGWQGTISQTRQLCVRVEEICVPPFLTESLQSCCRTWQHELKELRHHEDRLNELFSDPAGEAARLRAVGTTEAETLATLQTSVTNLSEELSTLSEEVEKGKSEAAGQTEAALDADKLPNLRKAFQRLRDESRQLEQRIGCVQCDITARTPLRGRAQDGREADSSGQPIWYSEDVSICP